MVDIGLQMVSTPTPALQNCLVSRYVYAFDGILRNGGL